MARLVSLRRAFLANPARRVLAWWAGMVAAGVVPVLLLEGVPAPAVPGGVVAVSLLWLGGFWVGPRSSDAYLRRVMRAWRTWANEVEWAYRDPADRRVAARRSEGATQRFLDRLARLHPPPTAHDAHEELREGLEEYLDVLTRLHAAWQEGSQERVERAMSEVDELQARLGSSERRLRTSLDYDARWPSRDRPGA